MADVRAFQGLRYSPSVDLASVIAPPYDVISPDLQQELYGRSAHNIVRVEFRASDDAAGADRYAGAAADLRAWLASGVLKNDGAPALYSYEQEFEWEGRRYTRRAVFGAVRLEPWERGIVRPHERTLPKPKSDRLNLLRATRAQISPVYGLVRAPLDPPDGKRVAEAEADGQRHALSVIDEPKAIASFAAALAEQPIYIADGHHRYETALAYRDEMRAGAASWSGEEPANFVLMAITPVDDPGLVVLPTHRIVHAPLPADVLQRIERDFVIEEIERRESVAEGTFVAAGLAAQGLHALRPRDRAAIEGRMPADQPHSWKRLDVNLLEYGVLRPAFGIDDDALGAGAVSYTQDSNEAIDAVSHGPATCAFLVHATPVEQVLAVADSGARMPQKSTYFYPKLPTGLVIRTIDGG